MNLGLFPSLKAGLASPHAIRTCKARALLSPRAMEYLAHRWGWRWPCLSLAFEVHVTGLHSFLLCSKRSDHARATCAEQQSTIHSEQDAHLGAAVCRLHPHRGGRGCSARLRVLLPALRAVVLSQVSAQCWVIRQRLPRGHWLGRRGRPLVVTVRDSDDVVGCKRRALCGGADGCDRDRDDRTSSSGVGRAQKQS
jgi:hypothetical protein